MFMAMPNRSRHQPDQIPHSYREARSILAELASGRMTAKTLHRLRIHLRRLQALYELIGDATTAKMLSESVSRFSKLRTLQVFLKYLRDCNAPKPDRERIRRLIKKQRDRLQAKDAYHQTRQLLRRHVRPPMPAHARWLTDRLRCQRADRLERLRGEALAAAADPRRRTLHALRLAIKALRYQEEYGFGHQGAQPHLVQLLREAQNILGAYEERAQFKKLARRHKLTAKSRIGSDFRRARKLARALPHKLAIDLQPYLMSQEDGPSKPPTATVVAV